MVSFIDSSLRAEDIDDLRLAATHGSGNVLDSVPLPRCSANYVGDFRSTHSWLPAAAASLLLCDRQFFGVFNFLFLHAMIGRRDRTTLTA